MQVFKLFFKVLRKNMGQMIMYICIFVGVMGAFVTVGAKQKKDSYDSRESKFAVFDEDGSDMSEALISYLSETQKRVKSVEEEKVSVQDALYNRDVDCVINIPKGFGEAVAAGRADGLIEITTIPGSQASMLFETRLDSYMNMMSLYLNAGEEVSSAARKAEAALDQKAEVTIGGGKTSGEHSELYNFYNYLGWTLICVMIVGIAPVLQVYNRKKLRARIECSAYRFVNLNKELILGMMVTGALVVGIFIILSRVLISYDVFTIKTGLFILNMIVYAGVALSIAFLISKLTQSEEILSMCANVVSLGMAFLCGIFVPRELLGDTVVNIAHFLPAYWYASATDAIDFYTSGSASSVFLYMGVQLLFAVVFILAGMIVDRYKTAGRALA